MKKRNIILAVKVFSVVLWLFTLFFPTIYASSEKVEYVDINQIQGTYKFEVEFTKPVKEGNIKIGFYDENKKLVIENDYHFEDNNSKIVVADLSDKNFNNVASYDFESANVVTVDADKIDSIMYPVSIIFLILMFIVCRVRIKEYEVDGKHVEIYAGVVNHTVKIDEIVVHAEKYFLTSKKTMLKVPVSETHEMEIVFRSNNKIEVMTRKREIETVVAETVQANQTETSDENNDQVVLTNDMFEIKNSDETALNNEDVQPEQPSQEIQESAVSEDKNVEAVQAEIEAAEKPRNTTEENE